MPKFESIPELIAYYEARFLPEKAEGVDAVIQINLSADQAVNFYVTIRDQTLRVEEGVHESPLLAITSTVKDWLRLNNGEANPFTLMMQGKLKVEGPIQTVAKFQTMFA